MRTPGHALRSEGIRSGLDMGVECLDKKDGLVKDSATGLFVERRRAARPPFGWAEALETLNRVMYDQEKIYQRVGESEEKYRHLFDNAMAGIFQISVSGRPLLINQRVADLLGYDSTDQFMAEVLVVDQQVFVMPEQLQEWKRAVQTSGSAWGLKAEVRCRDGSRKWVSLNIRAVINKRGRIHRFEGVLDDVTARVVAEEQIYLLAYYDALTGLPNRTLFNVQLTDALTSARESQADLALLLLELDRFKVINDSFGHLFGDRLLQEFTSRIKSCVGEKVIISRMGGGEFSILLNAGRDESWVTATADRLVEVLSPEFSILGQSLNIAFNIGISLYPRNGSEGPELLQNADTALFAAKKDGANKVRYFAEEMNTKFVEELRLENGLRMAVDRKELFLLYQPQVNSRTRTITGLEALLRWQHPQFGLVPPDKFISIAESSGLIVPIGKWVLRTACLQAKAWQDRGLPPIPVAVNVSAVQIRQHGFPELIREVLWETGLDPKYLELELTESLLLSNVDVMFAIMQELKDMGVKLAIDDFGTGFSSLSYLRQFQVDRLKIDRSFVRDVAINHDDAAITIAIIQMAKALNLKVLAEGVETEAQLSFLQGQNCDEIQGFYFSRPVAVNTITEKLQSRSIMPA